MVINKCLAIWFIIGLFSMSAEAQESSFSISASPDTVYLGNFSMVKLTMLNIDGEITAPEWDESFEVGRPNFSSQTQITNSVVKQKLSRSFQVVPTKVGIFPLRASCESVDGQIFEDEMILIVLDNPDNTKQNIRKNKQTRKKYFDLPKNKPNKKRKIHRL